MHRQVKWSASEAPLYRGASSFGHGAFAQSQKDRALYIEGMICSCSRFRFSEGALVMRSGQMLYIEEGNTGRRLSKKGTGSQALPYILCRNARCDKDAGPRRNTFDTPQIRVHNSPPC